MKFSSSPKRPQSWTEMKLVDVCSTFTSGGTPSRKRPEFFVDGSIPWVKTKELNDGVVTEVEEFITPDAVKNSSAKILPKNTVLLAMYGATVGKLGVLGIEAACNQACAAMVPKGGVVDFRFLYYLLMRHREEIIGQATGGAQQNLSGELIKNFVFDFPTFQEQQAIAKSLWLLDEKIAMNRAMSKTLENIAQTIFKSWFIDFDPVRAKMVGERPVGMDEATSALFPDSMDDSELGPIPKGWAIKSFREIASISKSSINPQKYPEDEFRHYSIPDFDKQQYPSFSSGFEILSGKFLLTKSTVLLSKLNPETKRIWTVLNPAKSSVCSTEFIVLVPKDETLLPFIHALTRHPNFYERFVSLATGSTGSRQRVRPEEILSIGFIASGSDLLERFSQLVRPFIEQQDVLSEEIQTLVKVRNLLLPRLVSGELQIPEDLLVS